MVRNDLSENLFAAVFKAMVQVIVLIYRYNIK